MDSFKSSKDNPQSNKKSINIPTAIRFNVDEESLEDVCLAIGPNLDTSQVNTWQLIKGKVSQAMEDIKSSSNKSDTNDIDLDNSAINSIREKLSLDLVQENFSQPTNISTTSQSTKSSPQKLLFNFGRNKTANISSSVPRVTSDSISESVEEELSSIRKSFANLRLKAKKLNYSTNAAGTSTSEKPSTSINSFLRKRKTAKTEPSDSPSKSTTQKENEVSEVESGVEMFEDTLVLAAKQNKAELTKDIIPPPQDFNITSDGSDIKSTSVNWIENIWKSVPNFFYSINNWRFDSILDTTLKLLKNFYTITGIILIIFIFIIEIPEFFRGILTCLLSIMVLKIFMNNLADWINEILYSHENRVEQSSFQIPDYNKMDILQIPIEEHKSYKKYSGWMHEANSYDPTNHHIPSVPVFLQLDGSILRLSNTALRISKRLMWNEKKLDKNNTSFTYHRNFDLTGCRIEMLPKGLARKRYYNRKYPMQLTIKNYASPSQNNKEVLDETIKSFHIVNSDCNLNDENNFSEERPNSILLDVGTTILESDLQKLQEYQPVTSKESSNLADETRILLFARCDREKEDWYRRFYAASIGSVIDLKPKYLDSTTVSKDESEQKVKSKSDSVDSEDSSNHSTNESFLKLPIKEKNFNNNNLDLDYDDVELMNPRQDSGSLLEANIENFKGLLFSGSIYRNPTEYISFMSKYQTQRKRTQDDELWKGLDQTTYFGPQESEVWTNVIIGRLIFSCLTEKLLLEKIQEFLQKKLSAIKLPSFMEDVSIAHIHLGQEPPLIHRISQPLIDERGVWIDADITYEGLMDMTIKTKLNLLRLKRSQHSHRPTSIITTDDSTIPVDFNNSFIPSENIVIDKINTTKDKNDDSATILFKNNGDLEDSLIINAAIYDSDAESSGASSSESSSPTHTSYGSSLPTDLSDQALNPGGSRRLLRIVDRITTSNLFQSATEISYVQRAMENMSTKLALRVDLKGLVSRVVINIPPPPTDRVWLSFRSPPRLWITAKPAVGEHQFDWSIITNVIENKLYDEVCKYLVYPNMIDIIIPFLGESTYKE